MANPKRKHTRSRRNSRRANWKAVSGTIAKCSNCGAVKLSHHVCPKCGFYNSELIFPPKVKKTKQKEEK